MQEMRISDLARVTGFTPPTIRYYEKVGLLPEPRRTDSGYRVYDADAEVRLHFIARAKRLDLSLGQIRELLAYWKEGDVLVTREQLQRLLLDKLEELNRTRQELAALSAQLELAYRRLAGHGAHEVCHDGCGCPPDIRERMEAYQPLVQLLDVTAIPERA